VEIVIGRIATDEASRARILANPRSRLQWLGNSGLDLTPAVTEAPWDVPEAI
jgi:hypothetical protein